MPIIGTIREEVNLIFLKNKKKIMVPTNENRMAPPILNNKLGEGNIRYTNKSPY